MSCSVPGCSYARRFKPEGISFHTFPRGKLLKKWLFFVHRDLETWIWTKNKLICSDHFVADDFVIKGGRRMLKLDAIPSIVKSSKTFSENAVSSKSSLSFFWGFPQEEGQIEKIGSEHDGVYLSPILEQTLEETFNSHEQRIEKCRPQNGKTIPNYRLCLKKVKMQNVQLRQKLLHNRKKLYKANRKISDLEKEIITLKNTINTAATKEKTL